MEESAKEVPAVEEAAPEPAQGPFIYYVSPSGKDENSGASLSDPWKTIDRVNQGDYQAGDQILFQGSSRFSGSLYLDSNHCHGTAEAPVTIGSYGTGRAVIASDVRNGLHLYNVGNFIVTDLYFLGTARQEDAMSLEGPNGVLLNEDGSASLENVVIQGVEVSGYGAGIVVLANAPGRYAGLRIEQVAAHDNLWAGILLFGPPPSESSEYPFVNIYVGNCQTYRNSHGSGVVVAQADWVIIERNVAYENGGRYGYPEGNPGGGSSGICAYGNRITLQHNEVYGQKGSPESPGHGEGFHVGGSNSILQYNYAHDNEGVSFLLENPPGSRNHVVRFNISENDGLKSIGRGTVTITGGDGNYQIYNNTMYADRSKGSKGPLVYVASSNDYGAGTPSRIQFWNNLWISDYPTADTGPLILVQDPENIDHLRFENNVYHDVSGRYEVWWGADRFRGILAWSQDTGQEIFGDVYVGKTMDPRLCNQGHGGILFPEPPSDLAAYRLRSDSPLIDKGQDLTSLGVDSGGQDFFGNPVPAEGGFDIGAHEHQSGEDCG